MSKAVY